MLFLICFLESEKYAANSYRRYHCLLTCREVSLGWTASLDCVISVSLPRLARNVTPFDCSSEGKENAMSSICCDVSLNRA